MDFAALMNKELSKAKPADEGKKYLKRSEVEAERRAAYLAEQKAAEAEREAKAAAKRRRDEAAAADSAAREEKRRRLAEDSRRQREAREADEERGRRKRLGLPELVKAPSDEAEAGAGGGGGGDDIADEELVARLRARGHAARLFGESHAARLRRYRKATTVMTGGPIPTTLELVAEKDMRVDGAVPKDREGRRWLFRQLASYFSMVLTAYERAMEGEKSGTAASKTAYQTMVQTRENMKPVRGRGGWRGEAELTRARAPAALSQV